MLAEQSPAAIAGRLKNRREPRLPYVSKDSLYRYLASVQGRQIEAARQKKKRQTRKRKRLGRLGERTFIDQRPKHINARLRIGQAEADFILSGKNGRGILLVVVDRKLRVAFLEPLYRVKIKNVHRALARIKRRYPEWQTMTTDNDLLWQRHREIEQTLNLRIFFCHPYHSWEKGTVENVNGEIRKDLPKGSDISHYPPAFFRRLEQKLNDRFLECLGYLTPTEVLERNRKQKRLRGERRKKKKTDHSN